jgi:hypothetical protein
MLCNLLKKLHFAIQQSCYTIEPSTKTEQSGVFDLWERNFRTESNVDQIREDLIGHTRCTFQWIASQWAEICVKAPLRGIEQHTTPSMREKNRRSQAAVQYADLSDTTKMLNIQGGVPLWIM